MRPQSPDQASRDCRARSGPADEKPAAPRIGIVGGGFSGTLVLANLIAEPHLGGATIELFEARDDPGPGIAYGTVDAAHLLNVPAGRMGARASAPDDFCRWLQSEPGQTHCARIARGVVEATDFAPRALYGRYLEALLREELSNAVRRGITVRVVRATVIDMTMQKNAVEMTVRAGDSLRRAQFDAIVLATGNFPPRCPTFVSRTARNSSRYIGDLWRPPAGAELSRRVAKLSRERSVMILGSGLTAIDAVLSLRARGFKGRIVMVSRNGRFPLPHAPGGRVPWTLTIRPEDVAPKAHALLSWLRREARLAEAAGVDWRGVLDALRPHTRRIWRTLEVEERRKLLRKLSLWNVHRHRLAPRVRAEIEALQRDGTLEICPARVSSVRWRPGGLAVKLRRKGVAVFEIFQPSLILNCTGPEHDVTAMDDPLLKNLLRKQLIVRSPAGGIAARDMAIAEGRNDGRILAIGPLLIGELLEATAVPELRELAKHVAERVCARLREPSLATL